MLETFQDRLVTELRLAGASSIDKASLVLQEFCPSSTSLRRGGGAAGDVHQLCEVVRNLSTQLFAFEAGRPWPVGAGQHQRHYNAGERRLVRLGLSC